MTPPSPPPLGSDIPTSDRFPKGGKAKPFVNNDRLAGIDSLWRTSREGASLVDDGMQILKTIMILALVGLFYSLAYLYSVVSPARPFPNAK